MQNKLKLIILFKFKQTTFLHFTEFVEVLEIRDKSLVKYPTIFRTEYFHNLRLKIGYKAPKQAQVLVKLQDLWM